MGLVVIRSSYGPVKKVTLIEVHKISWNFKNSTATTSGGEKNTIFAISIISDIMCIHVKIFMKIWEKSYLYGEGLQLSPRIVDDCRNLVNILLHIPNKYAKIFIEMCPHFGRSREKACHSQGCEMYKLSLFDWKNWNFQKKFLWHVTLVYT